MRIRGWSFVTALSVLMVLGLSHSGALAGADKATPVVPRQAATDSTTIAAGQVLFTKYCQLCHGPTGHGDGPGSVALNPKPRNFTQPSQFKSKNDEEVFQVISRGGAARKLSAAMPPWGPTLKPAQIWQLIAFVRSFPVRDSMAKAHAKP